MQGQWQGVNRAEQMESVRMLIVLDEYVAVVNSTLSLHTLTCLWQLCSASQVIHFPLLTARMNRTKHTDNMRRSRKRTDGCYKLQ